MNEQELKEIEKRIRSEIAMQGYRAGLGKLTYEQRKENGKKGGLASVEKKRLKKAVNKSI